MRPGSFRLTDQFVGAAEPGQYGREGCEIIKLIHRDGKRQEFNPGSHERAPAARQVGAGKGASVYSRVRPRKTRRPAVQFELPLAKYSASAELRLPFNGLNDSPIATGWSGLDALSRALSTNWFNFSPACKLAVDGNSQRWALCLIPTNSWRVWASFSPRESELLQSHAQSH